MPRRYAQSALSAVALFLLLAGPADAELDTLAGQHLYTIEWQWLHLEFTFLDSTMSDTVWVIRDGDSWFNRTAFYRLDFPAPLSECSGLGIQAWSARLSPDEETGLLMQFFPQDADEEFSFPEPFWIQSGTYHACPLGELSPHRSPPSWDSLNAWELNHYYPNSTHLIIGVGTLLTGDVHLLDRVELLWDNGLDVVESPLAPPIAFELLPCYPNPFNSSITVPFTIPTSSLTTVEVYNLLGQRVAMLWNGRLPPGLNEARWSPEDVGSGTYIVIIRSDAVQAATRIQLIR